MAKPPSYTGPRFQRRMHWLKELVREQGGPKMVGQAIDTPNTHITAMTKGNRGIGDEMADRLERKFNKPNGWMDRPIDAKDSQPPEPALEEIVIRLATHLNGLTEAQAIAASESLSTLAKLPDSKRAVDQVLKALSVGVKSAAAETNDFAGPAPSVSDTPADVDIPAFLKK